MARGEAVAKASRKVKAAKGFIVKAVEREADVIWRVGRSGCGECQM